MTKYDFTDAQYTNMTEEEILLQAKKFVKQAPYHVTIQDAIIYVIDAAAEYTQGN